MSGIDEKALAAAHLAVEQVLVEWRDARLSVVNCANGFVIREKDGTESSIMRLGTRDGLRIAVTAYLKAVEQDAARRAAERKERG